MSVLDKLLVFSDAQALANLSIAAIVVSTVVADLGPAGKDGWGAARAVELGGESRKLEWTTQVNTILVTASAGITVSLVTKAADASLSSGGTVIDTFLIPAESAAGTRFRRPLQLGTALEYLGVLYTGIGAKLASAKIDSWIGYASYV